ncbi:MAG TPA: hypothetical protein VL769_06455 [Acidimicrobiia bacterium]|nr:hypothetical protein [Acidimicrobiia bacterium]
MKGIIGAAIAIFAVAAPAIGSPGIAGAAASGCSATSGVTVIVDFTHFGGGKIERGCAPGDPTNGLQALHAAGFTSAGTAQYGDAFVCRIDGLPTPKEEACAVTPPPSAYWAYWYARPSDPAWTYSAVGVLDFDPKPGSIEAFAFGNHAQPGIAPSAAMPTTTTTTTTRPTPTTHAPPTTGSQPITAATLPVAPGPTAPPLVGFEPTTSTTTIKRAVAKRPTRKSTTTTAHTRASASTSTTVGIVERSASGPPRRHSSGSPAGAVLAIAIVGGLALGAFAFTRARRRRPV